jgi:anaerobic magnesium-protoporphyrin IX monomethyl ester cyclase
MFLMKVVLVRPPFYALFGVTAAKMKTYPLNLLYLATFIAERSDHEAVVVDGENVSVPGLEAPQGPHHDPAVAMHQSVPKMVEILENPRHELWTEMERRILAPKPDLVGITCNSGNMDTVRLLVQRLKALHMPVILGGSHPSVLPEQSLRYTGADMVAIGEGELTLGRVMDSLSGNGDLSGIPSLAWKSGSAVFVNPRGELIRVIDDLPIPARSFINRADYFGEVIMTGRGCPFNCSYCASRNIWGRVVRLRSTTSVMTELEALRAQAEEAEGSGREERDASRPGRWVVKVVDDTFTVSRTRTMDILQRIIDRGLTCFEFTGGVRADTLDEALVQKMAEANFQRVTLGVESGSPRILKMIRKGETNEDVKRAVELLRGAGIHTHAFFMIGLPEETIEDIELSKKLIREVRPDHVEINMVTPYPGTELFDKLIPENPLEIDRWYRWFHQGMATHSDLLGYDLDAAYEDFLRFAGEYNAGRKA